MPFQKGTSGNPNGRPLKNRAWTRILETAGNKAIETSDGQRLARKRIIADLIMQVAATGKAVFPDGAVLEVSPKDWLDFVWKIYGQIDGPPKVEMDVTSGGEVINTPVVYLPAVPDDSDGDSG